MPRGKAIKRSLDEQITILEEDIRIAQNKLNKLQNKWRYFILLQISRWRVKKWRSNHSETSLTEYNCVVRQLCSQHSCHFFS